MEDDFGIVTEQLLIFTLVGVGSIIRSILSTNLNTNLVLPQEVGPATITVNGCFNARVMKQGNVAYLSRQKIVNAFVKTILSILLEFGLSTLVQLLQF